MAESSGLVFSDGKLWTHNDSGNPAVISSIDTATGTVLQTIYIDNFPNTDWEDITADSAYLYIADCGNNNGDRHDLKILKIAKAGIGAGSIVHVNAQAIYLSYADQTSFISNPFTNYDCEAIISLRDSLYLFTKDRGDNQTRVYRVSKAPGTYSLSPYTSYNVGGLITGASYNAQTAEIMLIGYSLTRYNSFLMLLNNYAGDMFFSGNKRTVDINNGGAWQTEAVAWMPGNRLFISCETYAGIPASLYSMSRTLPSAAAVAQSPQIKMPTLYPNPAQGVLHVTSPCATRFQIVDPSGQTQMVGSLSKGDNLIRINTLVPGTYMLTSGADNSARHFVKQ
jgi:hypothetical protein